MLPGSNFVRTKFKKFQSLTPDPDTIYFLYDIGAIYLGSVCVGNTLRGKSGIVISDSEPNDPDHPVWLDPDGEVGPLDLDITGASIGQVPTVKSVDENGVPTEWEAVELPRGAYIVNLTMDDSGNITADKTFAEIKAAYDDGKVVDAKFEDAIVPLCSISDSEAFFAQTNANSFKVLTVNFTCTSDNVWSMSQTGFDAYTLGISGAAAGQIVTIKAVDAAGIPTEWEAADAASGEDWEFINEISTNEWISSVTINQDSNGNPFSLKKMRIFMTLPKTTNEAGEEQSNPGYAHYKVNDRNPAWQSPAGYWESGLFLWTIEAFGDYYIVSCWKDGANSSTLHHIDVFHDAGYFESITSFTWKLFNANYGWGSTNFKVYGVKA